MTGTDGTGAEAVGQGAAAALLEACRLIVSLSTSEAREELTVEEAVCPFALACGVDGDAFGVGPGPDHHGRLRRVLHGLSALLLLHLGFGTGRDNGGDEREGRRERDRAEGRKEREQGPPAAAGAA